MSRTSPHFSEQPGALLDGLYGIDEKKTANYSMTGDASGQAVHLSLHAGTKYRDDEQTQNDRATAIGLPGLQSPALAVLADTAALAAEEAVSNHNRALREQQLQTGNPEEGHEAAIQIGKNRRRAKRSNSTLALGVYDPATQRLWVRSRGDSAIYLVLNDRAGKQQGGAIALCVPHHGEVTGNRKPLANYLGITAMCEQTNASAPPVDIARYELPGVGWPDDVNVGTFSPGYIPPLKASGDPLELKPLIADMALRLNIPVEQAEASLVAATDFLTEENTVLLGDGPWNERLAAIIGPNSKRSNIATALSAQAALANKTDNRAVVVLPDIQANKGAPVLFCVCDGVGSESGVAAQIAIDVVERSAAQALEKERGNQAWQAREDKVERNALLADDSRDMYASILAQLHPTEMAQADEVTPLPPRPRPR